MGAQHANHMAYMYKVYKAHGIRIAQSIFTRKLTGSTDVKATLPKHFNS